MKISFNKQTRYTRLSNHVLFHYPVYWLLNSVKNPITEIIWRQVVLDHRLIDHVNIQVWNVIGVQIKNQLILEINEDLI